MLPQKPGVYIMRDRAGVALYIGKAVNIRARVGQYFQREGGDGRWQIPALVPLVDKIDFVVAASERDALILEDKLIKQYQPFFNSMLKDAKTYPYIRLSMQEDYPRLTMTRRPQKDGALYYGPYPRVAPIKNMLEMLWKNKYLPLRPCKWAFSRAKPLAQKRISGCIYYHLNQCPAPCAGKISYKAYRALAARAKIFFDGDYKTFAADTAAAMRAAAKVMDYETAALQRDFLAAIEHMKERIKVSEYKGEKLQNKIAAAEKLKALSALLGSQKIIRHIEAFDNSHLYGKHPVGAMVCFVDGDKYKAHYRRFKIRTPAPAKGADDFAMMREIVSRRLAQTAQLPPENRPDLFVIDGGPMQLDFALKALNACGQQDIKVISLAKREEEIFIPGRKESVKLEKNNPALLLLMQIRDEVHRFAITYNRLLRSKSLLK